MCTEWIWAAARTLTARCALWEKIFHNKKLSSAHRQVELRFFPPPCPQCLYDEIVAYLWDDVQSLKAYPLASRMMTTSGQTLFLLDETTCWTSCGRNLPKMKTNWAGLATSRPLSISRSRKVQVVSASMALVTRCTIIIVKTNVLHSDKKHSAPHRYLIQLIVRYGNLAKCCTSSGSSCRRFSSWTWGSSIIAGNGEGGLASDMNINVPKSPDRGLVDKSKIVLRNPLSPNSVRAKKWYCARVVFAPCLFSSTKPGRRMAVMGVTMML